jgi:hypothetical protein
MKQYGKIFLMAITMSFVCSLGADELSDRIQGLHQNLVQLRAKLNALKDGLEAISKHLRGDEKVVVHEAPEELLFSDAQQAEILEILNKLFNHIQNPEPSVNKFNLLEADANQMLSKNQIQDDIDRFNNVLELQKSLTPIKQALEGGLRLSGKEIADLRKAIDTFMGSMLAAYEPLNIFRNVSDIAEHEGKNSVDSIGENSNFDDFKVFTRAKKEKIDGAWIKAKDLVRKSDFWYSFNNKERLSAKASAQVKFSVEAAEAGGRLIDFYLQELMRENQAYPVGERDQHLSEEFIALAEMFSLRTQATIALYPFLSLNLRSEGFLQCVIDVLLAVIGQKSHANYYCYKYLANPSVERLLSKISDGTYAVDDLIVLEKACLHYNPNTLKDSVRVPDYRGGVKPIRLNTPYTPQGVRTKMELLGMIYARQIKDILPKEKTENEIINELIEKLKPLRERELEKEIEKIKDIFSREREKIERELEVCEREIAPLRERIRTEVDKLQNMTGGDVEKIRGIDKEIDRLRREMDNVKPAEDPILEEYERQKALLIQPDSIDLEKIAREKIVRDEINSSCPKPRGASIEVYIQRAHTQLGDIINQLVNQKKTLIREEVNKNALKYAKEWTLDDIFSTLAFICNHYSDYFKQSSEENQARLKEIIQQADSCAHHVLTHRDTLRLICPSLVGNKTAGSDLQKLAFLLGGLLKMHDDVFDGKQRKITRVNLQNLPDDALKIPQLTSKTVRMYLLVEAGCADLCNQDELAAIIRNDATKGTLQEGEKVIADTYNSWQRKGAYAQIEVPGQVSALVQQQRAAQAAAAEAALLRSRQQVKDELEREYQADVQRLEDERDQKLVQARDVAEKAKQQLEIQIQEQLVLRTAEQEKDLNQKKAVEDINTEIVKLRVELQKLELKQSNSRAQLDVQAKQFRIDHDKIQSQISWLTQTLSQMTREELQGELKRRQQK